MKEETEPVDMKVDDDTSDEAADHGNDADYIQNENHLTSAEANVAVQTLRDL